MVRISFIQIEPDNKNDSHAIVIAFRISIQKIPSASISTKIRLNETDFNAIELAKNSNWRKCIIFGKKFTRICSLSWISFQNFEYLNLIWQLLMLAVMSKRL